MKLSLLSLFSISVTLAATLIVSAEFLIAPLEAALYHLI